MIHPWLEQHCASEEIVNLIPVGGYKRISGILNYAIEGYNNLEEIRKGELRKGNPLYNSLYTIGN